MHSRAFAGFLGCFLALFYIHSAVSEDAAAPYRIGAISVLSGEGAAWGENHRRGSLLALEEFNASGGLAGRPIEIIFEDSPSGMTKSAVTAYTKLTTVDSVRFILGPLIQDETLAVAPLAKRDRVFLIGTTYQPEKAPNLFTTWLDVDIEADILARRLRQTFSRIAILSSNQSWESQVAHRVQKTFLSLGGTVAIFEEPPFDAVDVKAEALRVKRGAPEAIFISSYFLLSRYTRELHTIRMNVPLFSIELDQSAIDGCAGAAEGLEFIGPKQPAPEFIERFTARWRAAPDIPAAHAYDAATILFAALRKKGTDYDAITAYFSELPEHPGVTGRITSGGPDSQSATSYYRIVKGRIAPVPAEQ